MPKRNQTKTNDHLRMSPASLAVQWLAWFSTTFTSALAFQLVRRMGKVAVGTLLTGSQPKKPTSEDHTSFLRTKQEMCCLKACGGVGR